MLHLSNPNLGPPGSFRLRDSELAAVDPRLAMVGPFHALKELEDELNKRRVANGLSFLTDQQIQNLLCETLPPGYCKDENNQPTLDPGGVSLTIADVQEGTRTLLAWAKNGMRRVPDDEIVRRSYICNSCPWHRQILGCMGCSGATLRGLVNRVIGGRNLATDGMLGACGVCKCSLVAKTRMPLDDIVPNMAKEKFEKLWDKCWIRDKE